MTKKPSVPNLFPRTPGNRSGQFGKMENDVIYIRQIATATALYGLLSIAGLLPGAPALADTATSNRFYDVFSGRYVTIKVVGPENYDKEAIDNATSGGNDGKPAGRLEDQASLPDHLRETLTNQ